MEEGLSNVVSSSLPLRIIEYAFTHHMMDVLQVLGPPPWLEGDLGGLTLKDSCSIRVVAAEAWIIMERRDIKHFEQVMEFLNITHTLLPHAVTPIKHMKIMFGLKTLIIMWMLRDDEVGASVTDKIVKFFPDTLPQYHRSSRRHMELMQRTQMDFKKFAKSLARSPEIRKAYMKEKMQEQYGKGYANKLKERLLHYLEELDKALPQPSYIDQLLNKSQPLGGREELLHQILTCDSASPSTALKKLLKCVVASYSFCDYSGPFYIDLKQCPEGLDENQSCKLDEKNSLLVQEGSLKMNLKRPFKRLHHDNTDSNGVDPEVCSQMVENASLSEQKGEKNGSMERLCSRHGKQMKSILLECSEELVDLNYKHTSMQTECIPTPVLQPTAHGTSKVSHQGSSCSTRTSLSLYPDSSNLDEVSKIISAQTTLSHQTNCLCTSLVHNNFSVFLNQEHHVAPTFSAKASLSVTPSLQLITPSSESSAQAVATLTRSQNYMQVFDPTSQALDEGEPLETGSPLKSIPVSNFSAPFETITPSPEISVQPTLSPGSSSSFNLSPFPLNQILQASTSADEQTPSSTSSLPPTSSSKSVFHAACSSPPPYKTNASSTPITTFPGQSQQQKTVKQFLDADVSFNSRTPSPIYLDPVNASLLSSLKPKSSPKSSSNENPPFPVTTQASLSVVEQEFFLPLFHQPLSSTSTSSASFPHPLKTFTPTQNDTNISDLAEQDDEPSMISCNPRLSLETQSFLLLCKWLQPHVKLHRLSQQRVNQATLMMQCTEQSSEEANEYEDYSFDVNALYTDSESDPQYSDDPDYNPPKKWKL